MESNENRELKEPVQQLWMNANVYPYTLEAKFQRIFNQILEIWNKDLELDNYMKDLMVADREGRSGFPSEVATEIFKLMEFHDKLSKRAGNTTEEQDYLDTSKMLIESMGYPYSSEGFIRAIEEGNDGICQVFLESAKYVLDGRDERKWTPLIAASYHGKTELVESLLDKKANPNKTDSVGYAPLHWAALNGHHLIVSNLLKYHADPNLKSRNGLTPLIQAATRNNSVIGLLLLEHGAFPNQISADGCSALHKCAQNGYNIFAKYLIKHGAKKELLYRGLTAQAIAALNGHKETAQVIETTV